jgi:chromatin remodeling complex protein RSC6
MPVKKTETVATTPVPAQAKVVAAAPPAAPTVAVTGGKKGATKPASKPDAVSKVAATTAPVAPVVADTQKDDSNPDALITGLLEKLASMNAQMKSIQTAVKLVVKEFEKQKKIIDKVQKKKEKAKKSPSGFAKPCKISDELCDFMGITKGTEQSRTDITRHINSYVKEHNLNNPQNRREFFPDKKLKAILNVKDGEKVTYFVLQRLIAHHFPPSMSKLAAAAKAAV